MLAQRGVGIDKNHALFFQILADLVVHDLRLVLCCDTGDKALLFSFRNTQLVVGVFNVLGKFFPAGGLLLSGADEVFDVVEIDVRQVGAPGG